MCGVIGRFCYRYRIPYTDVSGICAEFWWNENWKMLYLFARDFPFKIWATVAPPHPNNSHCSWTICQNCTQYSVYNVSTNYQIISFLGWNDSFVWRTSRVIKLHHGILARKNFCNLFIWNWVRVKDKLCDLHCQSSWWFWLCVHDLEVDGIWNGILVKVWQKPIQTFGNNKQQNCRMASHSNQTWVRYGHHELQLNDSDSATSYHENRKNGQHSAMKKISFVRSFTSATVGWAGCSAHSFHFAFFATFRFV